MDINGGGKLVTCPYDEAHKMKASRLQLHIAKCKMNHLDLEKKTCPFNATHLLDRGEFDYHLQNCPDRGPLDRHMSQSIDKNNPFKGRTTVPHFSDPHIDDEQNWDIDASRTTVRLPASPPPGAIIEPSPMSKPAERKKLYRSLHQMSSKPENKSSPDTEVLRQPKQKSQGEQVKVQQTNPKMIENLGLGRGKPSRIAANIFDNVNNPNNESSANATYSNMVKDMSHLGLSRGRPVNEVPVPIFEKDDFPVLGCGRGILQAPKQNLRTPGAKEK